MLGTFFKKLTIYSLLVALISILLYHFNSIVRYFNPVDIRKTDRVLYPEGPRLTSHGWCFGSNHTNRRCRFKNLCYKSDTRDFIFIHDDQESIRYGIPEHRCQSDLAEMSSVTNHNQYFFNFVDISADYFQELTRQYRLKYFHGSTIIFGRFKPDNLMHLLHDDILPLYATIQEVLVEFGPDYNIFFHDKWMTMNDSMDLNFNHELYSKLFNPRHYFYLDSLTCFESALVGLNKDTLWYDYGFHQPQSPLKRSPEQKVLLRKTIRQVALKLGHSVDEFCPKKHLHVTLLTRMQTRLILNELQLIQRITESKRVTLQTIRIENFLFVRDILEKIKCTDILIGVHGSALALAAFLPPTSGIIEIFPYGIKPERYTPYKALAKNLGLEYRSWVNQDVNSSIPHPEYPPEWGGINHLSEQERDQIIKTQILPEHLCCSDPFWLYRIHQDTIVDTETFLPVFQDLFQTLVNSREAKTSHIGHSLYKLSPGPVLSIKYQKDLPDVHISWSMPWNLQFLNIDQSNCKVTYEILVTSSKSNKNRQVFHTSDTNITVKLTPSSAQQLIWVRCKIDNIQGPFNSEPIYC